MRTVKDTLSLGDNVFLLNTLCSLDVSFCSPSYHDSDILRSVADILANSSNPSDPAEPATAAPTATSAQIASNENSRGQGTAGPSALSESPSKLLIRLPFLHIQHVHCLVV